MEDKQFKQLLGLLTQLLDEINRLKEMFGENKTDDIQNSTEFTEITSNK